MGCWVQPCQVRAEQVLKGVGVALVVESVGMRLRSRRHALRFEVLRQRAAQVHIEQLQVTADTEHRAVRLDRRHHYRQGVALRQPVHHRLLKTVQGLGPGPGQVPPGRG